MHNIAINDKADICYNVICCSTEERTECISGKIKSVLNFLYVYCCNWQQDWLLCHFRYLLLYKTDWLAG